MRNSLAIEEHQSCRVVIKSEICLAQHLVVTEQASLNILPIHDQVKSPRLSVPQFPICEAVQKFCTCISGFLLELKEAIYMLKLRAHSKWPFHGIYYSKCVSIPTIQISL